MKWTVKGHQFDSIRKEYERKTCNGDGICIFGTGKISDELSNYLDDFSFVSYYIDNDKSRRDRLFHGKEVISLEDYNNKNDNRLIVVSVTKRHGEEIKKQLAESGLKEGTDYVDEGFFIRNMLSSMLFALKNRIVVELSQISVTERCSLKCKKCAHGCYAVHFDSSDMSLDEVIDSADQYFKFVDKCRYFVLIGGEPLLYRELSEAIRYIGKNYRNRIQRFQITTNGTIMPGKELLDACKEYDVSFVISNYSRSVPFLKERLDKLSNLLERENILFELFPDETEWMDYGFDHVNRKADEDGLIRVFDSCRTACHEIRNKYFYYCVMARSISENLMNGEVGKNDYLDLSILDNNSQYDRSIFVEYVMGYSEKGYLDMCNYCNGTESSNYVIPAAEQLTMGD